jgi:hypothetical protein
MRAALPVLAAVVACAAEAFLAPSVVVGRSVVMRSSPVAETDGTDALINELAACEVFDLPAKVRREGVLRAVGRPAFFLRIAERCDGAEGGERERLAALAGNLQATLGAIVEVAEAKMDDASDVLQKIVVEAAEADGEFLVPLSAAKFRAMQAAAFARVDDGALDEGVLTTVDAWAKKAGDDGLDGMVAILRKVLQLYAARALTFDAAEAAAQLAAMAPPDLAEKVDTTGDAPALHPAYAAAAALYADVLLADADAWPATLRAGFAADGGGGVEKRRFLAVVQAQIERVVLLQENGSFAQRVQAEFLKELVRQVEVEAPKSDDDDDDAAAFDPVQAILDTDFGDGPP